jgi:hypothetical protein
VRGGLRGGRGERGGGKRRRGKGKGGGREAGREGPATPLQSPFPLISRELPHEEPSPSPSPCAPSPPVKKYPYEPNAKKAIGMVAGGTGITPMLQVCMRVCVCACACRSEGFKLLAS